MRSIDQLRLVAALFLLPHFVSKCLRWPGIVSHFERARMPAPALLAPIGMAVEGVVLASLLTNYLLKYGALLGVGFMLIAAISVVRLNGLGQWRWEKGGPEYPLFWAAILAIVAVDAWSL